MPTPALYYTKEARNVVNTEKKSSVHIFINSNWTTVMITAGSEDVSSSSSGGSGKFGAVLGQEKGHVE